MKPLRRSPWKAAGIAVAVVCVVALGNLRLAASELRHDGRPDVAIAQVVLAGSDVDEPSGTADEILADENPADVIADASEPTTPGQLVPAIYAWDPDVRFVYFRHVSKWM